MTTRHKEKLPSHLSYPVGLGLLTTGLGQVPQADALSVSFHAHAGRANEFQHKRRSGEYYPVLTAGFHHWRLGLSESDEMKEQGLYDPTWYIVVYAVSRENRAIAGSCCAKRGFRQSPHGCGRREAIHGCRAGRKSPSALARTIKLLRWRWMLRNDQWQRAKAYSQRPATLLVTLSSPGARAGRRPLLACDPSAVAAGANSFPTHHSLEGRPDADLRIRLPELRSAVRVAQPQRRASHLPPLWLGGPGEATERPGSTHRRRSRSPLPGARVWQLRRRSLRRPMRPGVGLLRQEVVQTHGEAGLGQDVRTLIGSGSIL